MPKVRAPRVIDGELKDSGYPAPIVVGKPFWFEWLDSHESFHFEDREGKFTAVKTRGYWTAHRRVKGKLYRHYLGVSQDLTLNKLCEAAKEISTAVQNNTLSSSLVNQSRNPRQERMDCETDCETKGGNETNSKETTNAVRQWCVFARHNDGKLQFMGGYWSKGDATARMHKSQRDHHLSESIGDKAYIGPPPTYEVREMLVAPVGLYNPPPDCITEAQKVGADDLKEEVRRLQAVVRLEKQQKEMCQHKLDKAQQSNKELMNLAREARAELERLQSSTNSADPGAILNRLRKEYKNSKASLKDVELIIELLQAIAL